MLSELTNFNRLGYRGQKVQNSFFGGENVFLQITLKLRKLETKYEHRGVSFVETCWNICMLTLKDQCQSFTSVEGHMKSLVESTRSCCISGDAAVGTIPRAVSLLSKVRGEKRICSHMASNDWKDKSLDQNCIRVMESGLIGIRGISTFSHCLIMMRSQHRSDLRSPKPKFW